VIARHDIGLALELAEIPSRDLTITNKILQYLNAGLAVLATATQGQREVLAGAPDAGSFIALDDPAALAGQLDDFIADPVRLARRQAEARRLAETHYCWEHESPRLVALVAAALAAGVPRAPQ
jgi:glycosyltransferase involved in cell wall biosynthesis